MDASLDPVQLPLGGQQRSLTWRIFGGRADPILIASALVLLLFLAWAAVPGLFATHDPNKIGAALLRPPSHTYWFGTDEYGRDIYSRVVFGARIEFVISGIGVLIAMAIGIPVGLVAGYRGGWADSVLMRLQDALLAFPSVLFAILIVAARGASQQSIILTVGIIFIPRFARLVRASVLALKEEDFVTASRAIGATGSQLLWRHVLPNALPASLVQITLTMAVAVLVEAGLSYLGLGVQPPTATWGTMLKNAQSYPQQAPWYVLAPGICIFLLVLCLNTFGDGLRDRLDPRVRRL
ncbi:MAG: ABC transporter permease [Thermomicrobiales bacterium]|nr:MAG: ABC transporter permease [Thermomicrobiales bacterium]